MMKYSIAVGLPTNGTDEEISNWYKKIKKEINLLDKEKYKIVIIICINNRSKTHLDFFDKSTRIIYSKKPGKNNAVNRILEQAKSANTDIIYLSDDDVNFKEGSFRRNIEALIVYPKNSPILVGSDFKANTKGKSLLIKILCAPYEADSDTNNFLSGSSICSWTGIYPQMPESSTEIAEDSYVCIYYFLHFKNSKIIKPKDSIVYFEPALNIQDWYWQQIRTFIGIEKSFKYFGKDYYKAQKYFAWRYAENPKFRKNRKKINFFAGCKLICFRFFQGFVFHKGNKMMHTNSKIQWNRFRGEQ